MIHFLLSILFLSSIAHAKCDLDEFLDDARLPIYSEKASIYNVYGSSNIPSDVLNKAVSDLPVLEVKDQSKLEEELIKYFKQSTGTEGELRLVAPTTKPSSGATVYMIKKGNEDIGVAKIFGHDYKDLFREMTASEYLKHQGISTSTVFKPTSLVIEGKPKAFSFMTVVKGEDINKSMADTGDALKKLNAFEREAFNSGKYKNAKNLSPEIELAKTEMQTTGQSIEKASVQLSKIHGSSVNSPKNLEEVGKRKEFYLSKIDKQLESLEKLSQQGLLTQDEFEQVKKLTAADVDAYKNSSLNLKLISVTHGDAHTGNFMVNGKQGGEISMIDNQSLVNSFSSGKGSLGANESMLDLALLMESIHVQGQARGLVDNEIKFLQQKALRSYLDESKLLISEVSSSLNFHRLRFDLAIATSQASSNPVQAQAAVEAILKRYKIRE